MFSRIKKYIYHRGIKLHQQDINEELEFRTLIQEERYGLILDDIQTIVKQMRYKHKTQFICQLSSLMRIGEITQFRKKHLISNKQNIIVKIPATIAKLKKARTTFFSKEASRLLKPLLREINDDDLVLIGGSTHAGEEEILIRVFERLNKTYPNLKLILAPRHIERTRDVSRLIEKMGFVPVLKTEVERSGYKWQNTKREIILIDTVGDLERVYSLSNYVFVGKSLVPSGGQNMMEPAGLGNPVIFGPHTFNFKEEVDLLLKNDAAKVVETEDELFKTIEFFIKNPDVAKEMGLKAQKVVNEKRGATDRNIEIIRNIIKN